MCEYDLEFEGLLIIVKSLKPHYFKGVNVATLAGHWKANRKVCMNRDLIKDV